MNGLALLMASAVPAVVAALAAAATLTAVAAVFLLADSRRNSVSERLAAFTHAAPGASRRPAPVRVDGGARRVVLAAVDRLAARYGITPKMRALLEDAGLSVRPAEALTAWLALALLGMLAGLMIGGPAFGLVIGAAGGLTPVTVVRRRRTARRREFEEHLPDALSLLSGSLRAGFSLVQGLETIAGETTGVLSSELQRACGEVRLGRTVDDALDEVGLRMASEDLQWAVMAVRIHREVGGNLAELLDTVAHTMVQRDRLRREVRALTAEGRLSAIVLSLFPPAAAVILFLVQPDYMGLLFSEPIGVVAVVASSGLMVCGWWWLRRIVRIEG